MIQNPFKSLALLIKYLFSLINKINLKSLLINEQDKNNPTFCGHLFITGSLIILIGVSFVTLKLYADKQSDNWIKKIDTSSKNSPDEYKLPFSDRDLKDIKAKPLELIRFKDQWKEIQQRIKIHQNVMVFFYQQYYISISMTSGLAIIAGICLFFITQVGWNNANKALINIFIVTSSAGLLYQRLPEIFKEDINLGTNRSLYLEYTKLSNELNSYLVTKFAVNIDATKPNVLSETESRIFIHYIDKRLAELNQIPIEFDATSVIKLNDLQDTFNTSPKAISQPEK